MIKVAIRAAAIAVAVTTFAIALPAASIAISDLTDGNPVVAISADLMGIQTTISPELVLITGTLPNITVAPGTRSVILTEPSSDPFGTLSDFVTLTVGATAPFFSVLFESDTAPNFPRDIAALPAGTPTLLETGTVQDVTTILNGGALTITVQSDLATAEPAEPSSWLLVMTGLGVSIAWVRRKRISNPT